MKNNLECPVDRVMIDERRARMNAFVVVLLTSAFLGTGNLLIPGFLLVDFLLRGLGFVSYSPIGRLSGVIVTLLNLKSKPVDGAPKRFAAFTGAVFSAFILITGLTSFLITSQLIAAVLLLFAVLESFAGFCAGCYVFTLLKPFRKNYA